MYKIFIMSRLCCALLTSSLLIIGSASSATAQSGSAQGTVLDVRGAPIADATITAVQPDISARRYTATTDQDGQWLLLGLTNGPWEFTAEANGFEGQGVAVMVRVSTPPFTLILETSNFLPTGSLPPNILVRIDTANGLRREGDLAGAAAAYETLLDAVPKLTMINMVLAEIYREQAGQEDDTADQQALLLRAEEAEARLPTSTP